LVVIPSPDLSDDYHAVPGPQAWQLRPAVQSKVAAKSASQTATVEDWAPEVLASIQTMLRGPHPPNPAAEA
jgi:hypothetical protein